MATGAYIGVLTPISADLGWSAPVGATFSNGEFVKQGTTGWNSGYVNTTTAVSELEITATPLQNSGYCSFGLTDHPYTGDEQYFYPGTEYILYFNPGYYTIYELGNETILFSDTYSANDNFAIKVNNGVVTYYKNDTLVYTSSNPANGEYYCVVAAYTGGNGFNNISAQNTDPSAGTSTEVARALTSMYIGVSGIARKIKKAYIGVANIARLWWSKGYDPGTLNIIGPGFPSGVYMGKAIRIGDTIYIKAGGQSFDVSSSPSVSNGNNLFYKFKDGTFTLLPGVNLEYRSNYGIHGGSMFSYDNKIYYLLAYTSYTNSFNDIAVFDIATEEWEPVKSLVSNPIVNYNNSTINLYTARALQDNEYLYGVWRNSSTIYRTGKFLPLENSFSPIFSSTHSFNGWERGGITIDTARNEYYTIRLSSSGSQFELYKSNASDFNIFVGTIPGISRNENLYSSNYFIVPFFWNNKIHVFWTSNSASPITNRNVYDIETGLWEFTSSQRLLSDCGLNMIYYKDTETGTLYIFGKSATYAYQLY